MPCAACVPWLALIVVAEGAVGLGDAAAGTAQKLVKPSSPPVASTLPFGEKASENVEYARSVPASLDTARAFVGSDVVDAMSIRSAKPSLYPTATHVDVPSLTGD